MYNVSIECEIASMIAGRTVSHLTPAQATYLDTAIQHLPKKRADIIYERANGAVPSDTYAEVYEHNLQRALADARELIDIDMLTISSQPLDRLLELANGDTTKSYDDIIRIICEKKTLALRDPYIYNDETFHAFRKDTGEKCALAIYDCDKLLSEEAYTGELASFRDAIMRKFSPRSWDAKPTSYLDAIDQIAEIAKSDSADDKHYTEVVEKNNPAVSGSAP